MRKAYKQPRRLLPAHERAETDRRIAARLFASDFYRYARGIFLYVSVEEEVDTRGIITRALSDGKAVYAPRTKGNGGMDAVRIESAEALTAGAFGIPEPSAALPAARADELDLILVPSLACDIYGTRIGYGGGFYDRFLAQITAAAQGTNEAGRAAKIPAKSSDSAAQIPADAKTPLTIALQRKAFLFESALPREDCDIAVRYILTEEGFRFSRIPRE
ncbi:MAG: 5-formyltetrahydrofolate cyclo-ligase [Clostridiales Family XIII bacterium]|nr:5-formyltetrahydrofolate cyclo-ligase [Clostridiales Family XIII bacterium]